MRKMKVKWGKNIQKYEKDREVVLL